MRQSFLLLAVSAAALSSCGGEDSQSGGGSPPITVGTPTPTPTPTPPPTQTPTPTPTPTAPPTGGGTVGTNPGTAAGLYATAPDVGACKEGTLKPEVIQGVIDTLNEIRALHGLGTVGLSTPDSLGSQQSALMMIANNALSHSPPSSWKCYTQAGRDAAAAGNLAFSSGGFVTNEQVIAGWLDDVDNLTIDSVGHRRWLLDPFATSVAFGRVTTGSGGSLRSSSVLKVFNLAQNGPTPTGLPDFVAYPFGDYPAKFFDARALHSFGVIADKSRRFGANTTVDFRGATITMRNASTGANVSVSKVKSDNQGFGLANNVQFLPANIQQNVRYEVSIAGVIVNGNSRNFTYRFRIVP